MKITFLKLYVTLILLNSYLVDLFEKQRSLQSNKTPSTAQDMVITFEGLNNTLQYMDSESLNAMKQPNADKYVSN